MKTLYLSTHEKLNMEIESITAQYFKYNNKYKFNISITQENLWPKTQKLQDNEK